MPLWDMPRKAKVYEALGAVADGRVRLSGAERAEVVSSTGERTYTVTWSADGRVFSSNDNASYWQRSMGYPIVAVLLATGRLAYDPALAAPLAGVPWKPLIEGFKRDYDKAVTVALQTAEDRGADRAAIVAHAEAIYAQLEALRLERGPRGAPLERRSAARPGAGTRRGAPAPAAPRPTTAAPAPDFSRLTRPRQSMPDDVRAALAERDLMDAYRARPAYQQNDYLAWIGRAKRPPTRARRLAQMLAELEAGGLYMNMRHPGSAPKEQ